MNSVKMFHENELRSSVARREMTISRNRPSPLKISRDSHQIHKKQPSSMAGAQGYQQQQQQRKQPIIIYTQSPKVIHTRPHDFMALVQKLTGRSGADEEHDVVKEEQTHNELAVHKTLQARQTEDNTIVDRRNSDNETSSGVTDEISGGDRRDEKSIDIRGDVPDDSSSLKASSAGPNRTFSGFSPMQQQNQHPYFADIPMFTPTSMDQHHFLSSPRPVYRFSDSSSLISPSTLCGSISPSVFKFIKGLPEY